MIFSSGFCTYLTPRSGGMRPDGLGRLERVKSLETSSQKGENNDVLRRALVKTKLARDKCKAQLMMESHELLPSRNYKMMDFLGVERKVTSTLAILNTGAEPNVMRKSAAVVA